MSTLGRAAKRLDVARMGKDKLHCAERPRRKARLTVQEIVYPLPYKKLVEAGSSYIAALFAERKSTSPLAECGGVVGSDVLGVLEGKFAVFRRGADDSAHARAKAAGEYVLLDEVGRRAIVRVALLGRGDDLDNCEAAGGEDRVEDGEKVAEKGVADRFQHLNADDTVVTGAEAGQVAIVNEL